MLGVRAKAPSQPRSATRDRRSPERSLAHSHPDRRQHLGEVVSNRLVWESNHPVPSRGKDRLSFGILLLLLRVNVTVEFDRKTPIRATEVDDERPYRMLPPNLQPIQSPSAQFFPQDVLNRCLASAQIPRR